MPPNGVAAPVRTTGLTVIMVVFVLFGLFGLLSGFGAVLALAFEKMFEGMANPDGNPVFSKIQEAQAPFRIPGLILAAVNTILSIILLVAAVGLANRKRWGWNLSRSACMMGMVFEVLRIAVGVAQQGYVAMTVSSIGSQDMGGDATPEAAQMMMVSMLVGAVIGVVMLVIYAIGKMVVYYFSRQHLSKPEISGLFD
jgi:hypothetical protein